MWVEFDTWIIETESGIETQEESKIVVNMATVVAFIEISNGVELFLQGAETVPICYPYGKFKELHANYLNERNVTTFQNGAN